MSNILNWIKKNPNRTMFLIPILLVAGISISHVVSWYDIANPISWAIYLSIAIEIGAMTALIAATNKIKGGVWFMFGLVTFIQMIGNIFYSFKEIDPNGELFKSWVELTSPVWELMGSDPSDIPTMKRWLAFLEGGLLPIISLTSLHFFVKYEESDSPKEEKISTETTDKGVNEGVNEGVIEKTDSPKEEDNYPKIVDEETEKFNNLQKESDRIWEKVRELKKEGKLPELTEEDMEDEPSALAFTPYYLDDLDEEFNPTEELLSIQDNLDKTKTTLQPDGYMISKEYPTNNKTLTYTK